MVSIFFLITLLPSTELIVYLVSMIQSSLELNIILQPLLLTSRSKRDLTSLILFHFILFISLILNTVNTAEDHISFFMVIIYQFWLTMKSINKHWILAGLNPCCCLLSSNYCNSNLLIHPGYIISQALKSIFHRESRTIFHACNMVSSYISPLLKMWWDHCLSILPLIILFVIYSLHLFGFSLFFHTGCSVKHSKSISSWWTDTAAETLSLRYSPGCLSHLLFSSDMTNKRLI